MKQRNSCNAQGNSVVVKTLKYKTFNKHCDSIQKNISLTMFLRVKVYKAMSRHTKTTQNQLTNEVQHQKLKLIV